MAEFWDPWHWRNPDAWLELARRVLPDELGFDVASLPPGEDVASAIDIVWDQFTRQRFRYLDAPWSPAAGQQRIRDPQLVLRDGGTCIDLALVFAGLCLRAQLHPYLLIDPAFNQDSTGHAVVAVHGTHRLHAPSVLGGESWKALSRADLARIADEVPLVILDPVSGTRGRRDAPALPRPGRDHAFLTMGGRGRHDDWRAGDVAVVDVPRGQEEIGRIDDLDLSKRPALSLQFPVPPAWVPYPSRDELVEEVRRQLRYSPSPWILLHGRAGVGKSRLAHKAASLERTSGWFLNSSDRSTLRRSLAAAISQERGRSLRGTERLDRESEASDALARLHLAETEWVVVLDNANCAPSDLAPSLPHPRHDRGQRVIVTTLPEHLGAWRSMFPEATPIDIGPLPETDLAATRIDLGEAAAAAEGSPLLVGGYRALRASAGPDIVDSRLREAPGSGAARFWTVASSVLSPAAREAARRAAWLPPDGIPTALLGEHVAELEAKGLVARSLARIADEPLVDLHRSLGEAIRSTDEHALDTAIALLADRAAFDHLDLHGDRSTIHQLADHLGAAHEAGATEAGLGRAMVRAGDLFELHGLVVAKPIPKPKPGFDPDRWRSAEAFHAAASERADVRADPLLHAESLHGRARAVNQDGKRNQPDRQQPERNPTIEAGIDEAVGWMHHARRLRAGDPALVARSDALEALLRQKKAKFVSGDEAVARLRDVIRSLIVSRDDRTKLIRERRRLAGEPEEELDHDPELARARFNLAGACNNLAAVLPASAQEERAELLEQADAVYAEVGALRRIIYGDERPHQHVAACDWGRGLICYQRSWLLDRPTDWRLEQLRAANAFVQIALAAQERLDPDEGTDVRKSVDLITKIGERRTRLAAGARALARVRDESDREDELGA